MKERKVQRTTRRKTPLTAPCLVSFGQRPRRAPASAKRIWYWSRSRSSSFRRLTMELCRMGILRVLLYEIVLATLRRFKMENPCNGPSSNNVKYALSSGNKIPQRFFHGIVKFSPDVLKIRSSPLDYLPTFRALSPPKHLLLSSSL